MLFVIYRIVVSQTKSVDGGPFEKWIQILELVLNIGFSFVYLVATVISSFAVLLNLVEKVRNNRYLSLLTFLGIPSICVLVVLIDIHLQILISFSIIYLLLVTIQFLLFRNRINKVQFM